MIASFHGTMGMALSYADYTIYYSPEPVGPEKIPWTAGLLAILDLSPKPFLPAIHPFLQVIRALAWRPSLCRSRARPRLHRFRNA